MIEEVDKVPETYLKHIENTEGLYEIRIQQVSDNFRIFCFFWQRKNCGLGKWFSKENAKDTEKKIEKAIKIMEEYKNELSEAISRIPKKE